MNDLRARAIGGSDSHPRDAGEVSPSGATSSSDSGPRAASGLRIGFVYGTDYRALHSVDAHGAQLTHVAVEGLHVADATGAIAGQISNEMIAAVQKHGIGLLEVVDELRDYVPQPANVSALGRDREVARRFAANLESKLKADGAAGVVLALGEGEADPSGALRALVVEEVSAKLKAARLITAVRVDGGFVPAALERQAQAADIVVVRAFNELDPHSLSAPLAPLKMVRGIIDAAARVVPEQKLVIALSAGGGAWPVDGRTLAVTGPAHELRWAEAIALARTAAVRPVWDTWSRNLVVTLPGPTGVISLPTVRAHPKDDGSVGVVAWFADAATFADGLAELAAHHLASVAIEVLGGEDPRIWAVLQAQREDPEAIQRALVSIPHPGVPTVIGDGLEVRVDMTEHDGAAQVELSSNGHIATEVYDVLPAAPTVVRRAPVPSHTVVLTFDDGPDAESTPKILDILAAEGVKATFFMVGTSSQRAPDVLKRVVADGHELGNHSFSHPDTGRISALSASLEINATNRLFESLLDRSTVLFRPPFRADDTPRTAEDLLAIQYGQRNGMLVVNSNVDTEDWARPDSELLVDLAVRRLEELDGGVVLLHDGGGDRTNTVAALRPLIHTLRQRGFKFEQMHDLLGSSSISAVNPPLAHTYETQITTSLWQGGIGVFRALPVLAIVAFALGLLRFVALTVGALLHVTRERRETDSAPRAPKHSAVSVLIPAYNEAKVIERTIRSILASRGVDLEVLVLDDGSTDTTAELVSQAFDSDPRVQLIRLVNGGKARALNEGFKRASHGIVVALDADTLFLPDTILELTRKMDNPRVGAVAGYSTVGNTQRFIGRWQALEYIVGQALERRAWHLLGVVSVVPGVVGAWQRDAVLELGGFGTDTLAEDCDLTINLQVAGYTIEYAPNAVALTEAPESVRDLLKQRFRWSFGVLQTVWKHKRAIFRLRQQNPVLSLLLLPAVLLCHLGTPLLVPLGDAACLTALALGHGRAILPYAVTMLVVDLLLTVFALGIDRARPGLMWDWLLNRAVYRWLLFVPLCRAVLAALRGSAVGWGTLVRTGTVQTPSEELIDSSDGEPLPQFAQAP